MTDDYDWYDEDMDTLAKAMLKAQEAFNDYFDKMGLDGAYWELELTGYVLSTDFDRWKKITMEELHEGDEDIDG